MVRIGNNAYIFFTERVTVEYRFVRQVSQFGLRFRREG